MPDWRWHPERAEGDRWVEVGAPEPETTLLAAAGPVDILTAGGILRATEVVELAAAAGLDLAAAAVVLLKESGGGRNVFGHDNVPTGGAYVKGAEVTQASYAAYLAAVNAGVAGRNGVGPMQLTWSGYQAQADTLGGCWDWRNNVTVGFQALAQHIRNSGLRGGFRDYNGSGPAAERYADDAMARYDVWRVRLGTPEPTGDGDMTDEDRAMLVALYQYASGGVHSGDWPGWQTWPGGTNENLSATDYLRRANVQLNQLGLAFNKMQKQVAAKPAGMLRSDVNEIAATVAQHPAIAALAADDIATVSFWKATGERVVRAFAVSMLSLLGAGVIDIVHVPWTTDLSISGGAAVASLLASLIASQVGDKGSPSFLKGK